MDDSAGPSGGVSACVGQSDCPAERGGQKTPVIAVDEQGCRQGDVKAWQAEGESHGPVDVEGEGEDVAGGLIV